jgi:Baculovirus F protein
MLMMINIDWRVLLAALVMTIISTAGRANAEAIDHLIVFKDVGRVHQATATIHLTFNFDLSYLTKQCDKMETAMTEQVKTILGPSPISYRRAWQSTKRTFNLTCTPIRAMTSPGRTKRQIGLALGAAAVTAELLFDIYRQNQVQQLQQEVRQFATVSNQQTLVLHQQGTRIDHLEQAADQQGHELNELYRDRRENALQAIKMEWTEELRGQILELGMQARQITRGVRALERGHLSPHLLEDQQARTAYSAVQQQAQQLGGRLLTNHHTDLFQLPASFSVTNGDQYTAIVHVPVITETFDLLHFRSLPIRITNDTRTITIEVAPEKRLLAYNDKVHQELDDTDLQSCWKRERDHICADMAANQLQLRRTCLGALYAGEPGPIRQKCPLRNGTTDWAAEVINNNQVIVYTDSERRVQIQCANGSRSSLLFQGAKVIDLPGGCLLTSDAISIRTRTDVLLPPVMVTPVSWDLEQFLQGDQLDDLLPAPIDQQPQFTAPALHQQQVWRDELRRLRDTHQAGQTNHSYALVIISGVVLLLLVFAGIAIARWTYVRAHVVSQDVIEREDPNPYRCGGAGSRC